MNQKVWVIAALLIVAVAGTGADKARAIYTHATLVENDVYVMRGEDDRAERLVVNYPLIAGDIIYTNSGGRCELLFGNGTVMRLDSHTRIMLTSTLVPTLTSRKKITTLHMEKGQLYSMNQVYGQEIFQVITPAAAIKLPARSTTLIEVTEDGETTVGVRRGRAYALWQENDEKSRREKIVPDRGLRIFRDGTARRQSDYREGDFLRWNAEVNDSFKDLHYGKSVIPDVIYRRSPGIVHFAERFSTRYGRWVYDELFGYVWQPDDDTFHVSRPFFDANYVERDGQMILVPNQPWGWAPAHLGTWFWSEKDGWIWIPGDAFSAGICAVGLKSYPWSILYEKWLPFGYVWLWESFWRHGYEPRYFPSSYGPPADQITDLFEKLEERDAVVFADGVVRDATVASGERMVPDTVIRELRALKSSWMERLGGRADTGMIPVTIDWNPDSRRLTGSGWTLFYSQRQGSVRTGDNRLNSRRTSARERFMLRSRQYGGHGRVSASAGVYPTSATSVVSPATVNQTQAADGARMASSGSSGPGNSDGSEK